MRAEGLPRYLEREDHQVPLSNTQHDGVYLQSAYACAMGLALKQGQLTEDLGYLVIEPIRTEEGVSA